MSEDSMTEGWYYSKADAPSGREVGPLSWDELYILASNGTVEPRDIVWNHRLPRGMAAGGLPELFPSAQVVQAPTAQAVTEAAPPESPPAQPVSALAPVRSKRSEEPDADKPRNALPLLVVLLVLAVAAAGVAAYFLYFS